MPQRESSSDALSRRDFLQRPSAAAAGSIGIIASGGLTSSRAAPPTIIGEGEYRYGVGHDWATLPGDL